MAELEKDKDKARHHREEAEKSFKEDVKNAGDIVDKGFELAYNSMGYFILRNSEESKEVEKAFGFFDKVTEIKEDFLYAWHNKGIALHKLKKYEGAIECFNKAIKKDTTRFQLCMEWQGLCTEFSWEI